MIKVNKQIIIVILAGILITLGLFATGTLLKNKIQALNQQWDKTNHLALAKIQTLETFYQNFGYVGFIHHFKNYLLRSDAIYLSKAQNKLDKSIKNLNQLKQFKLNNFELNEIEKIEKVALTYKQKLSELKTYREQTPSLSITQIDDIIRVDDTPASEALTRLTQSFNDIGKEEKSEIKEKLEQSIDLLQLFLYILIPLVILVTTGYIIYILRLDISLNEIRAVFLSSPSALILSDKDGHILNQNKNAESLLGFSKDEFKQMVIEDLIHNDLALNHTELRNRFIKDNIINQNKMDTVMGYNRERDEFFVKTKNDELIPVKIQLTSYFHGKQLRIISSLTDLREKRLLEDNLQQEKDKSQKQLQDKLNFIKMMDMTNEELKKNLTFLEQKFQEAEQKRQKLVVETAKITLQKSDVLQRNAQMISQIQSYKTQIEILSEQIQSLTIMLNQDKDVY